MNILIIIAECVSSITSPLTLGVRDDRLYPFFDMTRILTWRQREQQGRPFQYLLENVQPGHLNNADMRSANTFLLAFLGDPFLLDVASVGSPSYRLRCYWTNILRHNQLQNLVPANHPVPNLNWFLEPEHSLSPVLRADRAPMRVLNLPGQPRQCLPTLVSFRGSHAFFETSSGHPRLGQILNHLTSAW